MKQREHEQIVRELTAKHGQTVRALEAQIKQLTADQVTLSQVPPMTAGVSRGLAHMAVQNGLAAHAVYKLGDAVTFLLFNDHDSFHAWVRAASAGRTVGAFHGGDVR